MWLIVHILYSTVHVHVHESCVISSVPQIDTNKLVVLIYSKIAFITNLFSLRLIAGCRPLITTYTYMYIVLYFRANWHLMIVLSICLRKKISLENVGKKRYTW